MSNNSKVYGLFVLFVIFAGLLLLGGATLIYRGYLIEVQRETPATIVQTMQPAPLVPPPAPGAVPGGTNLSNPVSASLTQISQITQTANAAINIPSPGPTADIGTILTYLLARGGRLDGASYSEEALRTLKNRTPWVCGGTGTDTICTYPAGIDTQQTWQIFFDPSTGRWNVRVVQ